MVDARTLDVLQVVTWSRLVLVLSRNLLHEMGFSPTGPSVLRIDNQSAISVAKHPEHHGRMKQLDLSWYWLRDVVLVVD